MSYSPTIYEKGDIITVEKLNHIENALTNINKQYVVLNFSYDINTHEITVINSITFAEAWNLMYNQNQLIFMRVIQTGEAIPLRSVQAPSYQNYITIDVISYMYNTSLTYEIFNSTLVLNNSSDILMPPGGSQNDPAAN